MSVQVIDLENPVLIETASALAPGRLRIGGSEVGRPALAATVSIRTPRTHQAPWSPPQGDKVFYDVDGEGCDKWSPSPPVDPHFCLNMTRWHQLIDFSEKTGVKIAFGLNAMVRPNNSAPSNLSNHEAFMAYTASHNLVGGVVGKRGRGRGRALGGSG